MASKKKNQAELNNEIELLMRKAGQSVNSTGNSINNRYASNSKRGAQSHVKIALGSDRPASSKRGGKFRNNKVMKKGKPQNQTDIKKIDQL